MLTAKQLKHFEKLAGKAKYHDCLSKINVRADRTEATDSFSFLVNIGENETPAEAENYPDTKTFIEMLNGMDRNYTEDKTVRVILNPYYVIDMMKALIDLSPNKGMSGIEVIIDKNRLKVPVLFKSVGKGATAHGVVMPIVK